MQERETAQPNRLQINVKIWVAFSCQTSMLASTTGGQIWYCTEVATHGYTPLRTSHGGMLDLLGLLGGCHPQDH